MKNKSEFLKTGSIKSLETGKINLSLVSNSNNSKKGSWHTESTMAFYYFFIGIY